MDQSHFHAYQTGIFLILPLVILVFVVIAIIPYWFIWKKAGFSPWLSLLMLVPVVGIIMPYVLAFSEWKVVPVNQVPPPPFTYPPPPPQL